MSREWGDLLEPEITERTAESMDFSAEDEEKVSAELDYESASGGSRSQKRSAEEAAENQVNDFIAGGCKPEGDGDLECRFNLGTSMVSTGRNSAGAAQDVKFTNPVLDVEDADSAKASSSTLTETNRGLAVVAEESFVFCTNEENSSKMHCREYNKSKFEDTGQPAVETEEGVKTTKGEVVETEPDKVVKTDSIKFPEGGKVDVVESRNQVQVSTTKLYD